MKAPNLKSTSLKNLLSYGSRLRPDRDWLVLLVLFTIALAASVVWNLSVFSRITKGQQVGTATVAQPVQLQLGTVTTLFTQRADERARYLSEYRFIDPSR
jgi:hypothetical protein